MVGEKAMGPNNEGTHWVRLEQKKDKKIIFKQVLSDILFSNFAKFVAKLLLIKVETTGDHLWALDKDNHIFYKPNIYDDINCKHAN